jgi:hypothetical protein
MVYLHPSTLLAVPVAELPSGAELISVGYTETDGTFVEHIKRYGKKP